MMAEARRFFHDRAVMEVDCPALSASAPIDAYIDLIPALCEGKEKRFLHSSPEYGMKRLLADGIGDIYQLSHVFRDGECGKKHNPEFMMAEWYRCGFSFLEMIDETLDFIRLFLGTIPSATISYRQAFLDYAGLDYLTASEDDLLAFLKEKHIAIYPEILTEGKFGLLNLILGTIIEPKLGTDCLCVLAHYPASQAALAKTITIGDEKIAERFEIYYKGVELANGYHELTDAAEQHSRFLEANRTRKEMNKDELPIDHLFLLALSKGLPDCCGVAVGFDRLMMLRAHADNIAGVIPFSWNEA